LELFQNPISKLFKQIVSKKKINCDDISSQKEQIFLGKFCDDNNKKENK
jgi:hypothetical protein